VDELVVNGDPAAKQKFVELAEFKRKPAVMRGQLGAIQDRFLSINQEKHNVAREVFASWYTQCQHVVRAAEHGLFCVLLGQLESSFYSFQDRCGMGGVTDNRHRPLLSQNHIVNLTAPDKSPEYEAGRHWYR
jgi:hypothetical protein